MILKNNGSYKALISIFSLIFVVGIISFSMCLSACEVEKPEDVEITFIHGWGSTEPDHVAMRKIYNDFEVENPGIKINMLSMPTNSEMLRVVEDMITSGNIPDVIFTAGEGESTIYDFMVKNEMLLNLIPYAKDDPDFLNNISPIITEKWMEEEGGLYTASDVLILSGGYWYNKDIFKKAGIEALPDTWEKFDNMLTKIDEWSMEKDTSVESVRPSEDAYLYIADNVMLRNGDPIDLGIVKTDTNGFNRICDVWEMMNSHNNVNYRNYSYRDEAELFNEGRLGVFINGVWGASMINENIDAAYALFPSDGGETSSCQSAALGYLLGNTGDEKRTQASIKFLKYMLSSDVQSRILSETQQMPSNPNINVNDYVDRLERFCTAVSIVQSGQVRLDAPKNLWPEEKREVMEAYLPKLFSGEIDREELRERLEI